MSCLLAKPWNPEKQDPTGYWMSEKLDGVRAIWRDGAFWSRNDKLFYAPDWFTLAMPDRDLDGELFIGRKKFDQVVSVVRSHRVDKGWNRVTYRVFDLYPGNSFDRQLVFEERQEILQGEIRRLHKRDIKFVRAVTQVACAGIKSLTKYADDIEERGGEGVMLRRPGSLYEFKRSSTLLKVKKFFDVEAVVVGHVPGKGKHEGRLGALDCLTPDFVPFQVGTGFTDKEREKPPKKGAKITVRYQELTKDNVPRFPVYITERDYE